MTPIFEIVLIAALLFIAAELYIIARELSRVTTLMLKERETPEAAPAGQTINVNLGPAQTGAAAGVSQISEAQGSAAQFPAVAAAEPQMQIEEAGIAAEPEPYVDRKPTPSGLLIVKCSKCQAENSSYRGECFNCGSRL